MLLHECVRLRRRECLEGSFDIGKLGVWRLCDQHIVWGSSIGRRDECIGKCRYAPPCKAHRVPRPSSCGVELLRRQGDCEARQSATSPNAGLPLGTPIPQKLQALAGRRVVAEDINNPLVERVIGAIRDFLSVEFLTRRGTLGSPRRHPAG
jgi:hypothetical protein